MTSTSFVCVCVSHDESYSFQAGRCLFVHLEMVVLFRQLDLTDWALLKCMVACTQDMPFGFLASAFLELDLWVSHHQASPCIPVFTLLLLCMQGCLYSL